MLEKIEDAVRFGPGGTPGERGTRAGIHRAGRG